MTQHDSEFVGALGANRRRTKIVATLGPSSNSKDTIRALALAGANVFRMNFSHGTHADHTGIHAAIRSVEQELGYPIAILADLQGPKLRVGTFQGGAAELKEGQEFGFRLAKMNGTANAVSLPHGEIYTCVQPGDDMLIDDGKIRMRAKTVSADEIVCDVLVGGIIRDRKGVNLPDRALEISALTDKDRGDLRLALRLGVDWVAMSFVQTAADIAHLREQIGGQAKIVAKIEKPVAVANFAEILEATDAVMVARGDLGVEYAWSDVPTVQKDVISKCRLVGKPVIVATQMLESMISSPAPTRAEVSDVANAIFDGADTVMLSAESAVGAYPSEAVSAMSSIAVSSEYAPHYWEGLRSPDGIDPGNDSTSIASAACLIAHMRHAFCIVTYSETGATAKRVANSRLNVPVLAFCPAQKPARQLALVWGVTPKVSRSRADFDSFRNGRIPESLAGFGGIPGNKPVVVTSGSTFGQPGGTDSIKIAYMSMPNKSEAPR